MKTTITILSYFLYIIIYAIVAGILYELLGFEVTVREYNNMHFIKHLLGKNKREIVFINETIHRVWGRNVERIFHEWMCWQCLECGKITKIKEVK